ncbi:MAG: FtsQ-type POTRA domain-containing protein [Patescibacteria group bacterium]
MFWRKKKNKRLDLESRAPKKRRSFFEKKEKERNNPVFLRIVSKMLRTVFLALVGYVLFFSPFLEIKEISVKGISELNYGDVLQKAVGISKEKYLRLIPKNNLIIFPSNKAEREILNSFKKISSVEVKKVFPDRIEVAVVERKSLLIWCSAGPCYVIDENGYAYNNADFESEEIKQNNLLTIIDDSAKPVILGEKVLNKNYIDFVSDSGDELNKELGMKITGEYRTKSRIAEEIRIKAEEGFEIFFSTSLPMSGSMQTLKTFLEKEMAGKDKSKLEYIDLRAENKVYYKFKDGESQNNTETQQPAQQDNKKDTKKKKN